MTVYVNLIECNKKLEKISKIGRYQLQSLPSSGDQIALPNVVGDYEIYSIKLIRHFPLREAGEPTGEPRIEIFIVASHDLDQEI